MAHSLSAKKRIRQNERRRIRNRARRTALRTKLRRCSDDLIHGNVPDAEKTLREASRALDCEADRGLIHRNAAARRKSRLARRLNQLKAKTQAQG